MLTHHYHDCQWYNEYTKVLGGLGCVSSIEANFALSSPCSLCFDKETIMHDLFKITFLFIQSCCFCNCGRGICKFIVYCCLLFVRILNNYYNCY